MPGGFGTLDEFFEALTLIQTKVMRRFPVVLMCSDFHHDLYAYVKHLAEYGTINKEDVELFLLTDSVEEMEEHIRKYAIDAYGLKRKGVIKPAAILGEKG
jgi:predicted Rossmann-fold nucleotide-binding protein